MDETRGVGVLANACVCSGKLQRGYVVMTLC